MTNEIARQDWKKYFETLTRERRDFETKIQVLSDVSGAQILSEGLPFVGSTFDEKGGEGKVQLVVGTRKENHQTHTIRNPKIVAFESSGAAAGGTLDIEEEDGTKTLIRFSQALPAVVLHSETESISRVSNSS